MFLTIQITSKVVKFVSVSMSSDKNPFCCLDEGDKNESSIEPKQSRLFTSSWADSEDDPFEVAFPPLNKETEQVPNKTHVLDSQEEPRSNTDLEAKKWADYDKYLSLSKTVNITHNVKVYNRSTKESSTIKNVRTLKITTKENYMNLYKLAGRYKPLKANGYFDRKDQKDKIDVANTLLNLAYKDPKIPCCFIYPVVIIELDNGKTITRNEIRPGSKCNFILENLSYFPDLI